MKSGGAHPFLKPLLEGFLRARNGELWPLVDMSTATAALLAKLTTDVASITDETTRLDCAVWLEEYTAALPASIASTSGNIASYSIAGRTVQYRNLADLKNRVLELRAMIDGALYGRGGVVDNRDTMGGRV